MTSDEAGLLQAIRENPGDDVPRLIYADWLADHGDEERGAFIRAEVRYERMKRDGATDGLHDAVAEIDRLWAKSGGLFACPLPLGWRPQLHEFIEGSLYPDRCEARVIRGFVAEVRCPLDAWREDGRMLVAAHPVERVEASDREPRDYGDLDGIREWRYGWEWRNGTWRRYHWGLPTDLYDALLECCYESTDAHMEGADPETLFFRTPEKANDALSRVLLALAGKTS